MPFPNDAYKTKYLRQVTNKEMSKTWNYKQKERVAILIWDREQFKDKSRRRD